jgi:hypothetical protein
MISKELLSEVLEYEVSSVYVAPNYSFVEAQSEYRDERFNIYELENICINWLVEKTDNDIEIRVTKDVAIVSIYFKEQADFHYVYAKTKTEAVFKTCEWILAQDKKCQDM